MKKSGLINERSLNEFLSKRPKEVNAGESRTSSLEQPTNDQSSNEHHKPDSASQAFVLKQASEDISDIYKMVQGLFNSKLFFNY